MKQVVKCLVVAGAMVAASSTVADMADVKPYVGVDYYQAWMKGKGQSTIAKSTTVNNSSLVAKSYPGASIYAGIRFAENFGAELGADLSSRKNTNYALNSATTITTKVRRTGGHLDLVGFLPMNDCVDLLASVGAGWLKPKTDVSTVTNGGSAVGVSSSSKNRAVFRLGVGASYLFTEMFGVRAKVGYEGTSALRVNVNNQGDAKIFKDSTTLNVGAFVKF